MWHVQLAKEQSRQADLHLQRSGFNPVLSPGIRHDQVIHSQGRCQGARDLGITPVQDPDIRRRFQLFDQVLDQGGVVNQEIAKYYCQKYNTKQN